MKPPRSILDPRFRYTPSARTDVGATIRRVLREQRAQQATNEANQREAERKTVKIKERAK